MLDDSQLSHHSEIIAMQSMIQHLQLSVTSFDHQNSWPQQQPCHGQALMSIQQLIFPSPLNTCWHGIEQPGDCSQSLPRLVSDALLVSSICNTEI